MSENEKLEPRYLGMAGEECDCQVVVASGDAGYVVVGLQSCTGDGVTTFTVDQARTLADWLYTLAGETEKMEAMGHE